VSGRSCQWVSKYAFPRKRLVKSCTKRFRRKRRRRRAQSPVRGRSGRSRLALVMHKHADRMLRARSLSGLSSMDLLLIMRAGPTDLSSRETLSIIGMKPADLAVATCPGGGREQAEQYAVKRPSLRASLHEVSEALARQVPILWHAVDISVQYF
jgi:hypothetical protein